MSERYSTAAGIVAAVEREVGDGTRPPGSRLPTVRAHARELEVAPGTVAAAYRALRNRGVVETDGRRGTLVRARPPIGARAAVPGSPSPGVRDLSRGGPDPALLPAVPSPSGRHWSYGDPAVDPRLLDAARAKLSADGLVPPALTLAGGALDGIERVLGAHLSPGDRVAVEDPGWGNLLDLLAVLGLVPEPVPVDDDGPLPDGLGRALARGARAVVVTSRAQNPTGAALSAARAAELAPLLRPDVLLVDDDYAAEVAGASAVPLAAAHPGPWAVVQSVSKAYGPDLRLAVVAGDEDTVDRVESRQRLGPGWVSHLLQEVVCALWADPAVAARLAAAERAYARRRAALVAALAGHGVAAHARSGLNVWVPVVDEDGTVARLRAAGWAVAPGARYRLRSGPGVRVTVAELPPGRAPALAADLAAAARPRRRSTY